MTASIKSIRTADSTDRTPVLTATKSMASMQQPKTTGGRIGGAAKRLLNALMRSLATPHV